MAKAERVEMSVEELVGEEDAFAAEVQAAEDVLEAARFIRCLRLRAGLTQQALADELGVSQPRVSAMEKGEGREGPTYGMLKRVARACRVDWSIQDLLAGRSGSVVATYRSSEDAWIMEQFGGKAVGRKSGDRTPEPSRG